VAEYTKPVPAITDDNREFWEGCAAGELRMQRCQSCGHVRYPVSFMCPRCLSRDTEWIALSGDGEVFSYIVFHRAYHQGFAGDVPYNVALVQLDEGPRMFSNVVGCADDEVRVGDRVHVVFDRVTEEVVIPRFQRV
jgi:uncharacterized protein